MIINSINSVMANNYKRSMKSNNNETTFQRKVTPNTTQSVHNPIVPAGIKNILNKIQTIFK